MAPKGLRGIFSNPSSTHLPHHHDRTVASATDRLTMLEALMEETITTADTVISKCDIDSGDSIFSDPDHGRLVLASAADLHRSMLFLSSSDSIASPAVRSVFLLRAHTLLDAAMRLLDRELRRLLDANSRLLHPLHYLSCSFDEENASPVANLSTVADAMVVAGYAKECLRVYRAARRSAVDDAIVELGFQSPPNVHKLEWSGLEPKIRSWLSAAPSVLRCVFAGERLLCDQVFGSDTCSPVRDSCFADTVESSAVAFLAFPELVASKLKRSSENLFQFLDLYDALAELWPEVESVFSSDAVGVVRKQALSSMSKLAEAARSSLENFENLLQRESSRTPEPACGVHPVTRFVMSTLVFLSDYEPALIDIYTDVPFDVPAPVPASFLDPGTKAADPLSPSSSFCASFSASPIAPRIASLLLLLLCKLDSKAELYGSVFMSSLFLANNLRYIVGEVRKSRLLAIAGEDWAARHAMKAKEHAGSYVRLAWGKVAAAIPTVNGRIELTAEVAADRMAEFNKVFEAASQTAFEPNALERETGEMISEAVIEKVVPRYAAFYDRYRPVSVVRFSPEAVRSRIVRFFGGPFGFDPSVSSRRLSRGSLMSRRSGQGSFKSELSRGSDSGSVESELSQRSDSSSVRSGSWKGSVRSN